jgi:hypothetical protein
MGIKHIKIVKRNSEDSNGPITVRKIRLYATAKPKIKKRNTAVKMAVALLDPISNINDKHA